MAASESNFLATTSDYVIKLWDLSMGGLKYTLNSFNMVSISSMVFIGNDYLAVGAYTLNAQIMVWDLKTGLLKHNKYAYNDGSFLLALNNGRFASLTGSGALNVWDSNTGNVLFSGFSNMRSLVRVNNRTIASNDYWSSLVRVLDVGDFSLVKRLEATYGNIDSFGSSLMTPVEQDGVLAACSSNVIKMWNTTSGTVLFTFPSLNAGYNGAVMSMVSIGNGFLAVGSSENVLFILDTVGFIVKTTLFYSNSYQTNIFQMISILN